MKALFRRTVVTGSIAAVLALGIAPVAMAAPATTTTTTATAPAQVVAGADTLTPTAVTEAPAGVAPRAVIGDGVWSPTHEESLALIPVCSGPVATLKWLNLNFKDHGNDVRSALRTNFQMLVAIVTFTAKPYDVLKLAFQDVLQVPVYAVNDTIFHQVPTVKDILSFCASTRG